MRNSGSDPSAAAGKVREHAEKQSVGIARKNATGHETRECGGKFSRCSPMAVKDAMSEIASLLTDKQKLALKGSPFYSFMNMPDLKISNKNIEALLRRYRPDKNAFVFGDNVYVSFESSEFCIAMGLKLGGRVVDMDSERRTNSMNRLFPNKNPDSKKKKIVKKKKEGQVVKRPAIVAMLKRFAGDDRCTDDLVRMYTLLVFNSILFPHSTYATPKFLLSYIDDLPRMCEYAWGDATHQFLVGELTRHARHKKKQYIDGCTIGLMAWLCERIPSLGFQSNPYIIPRVFRWTRSKMPSTIEGADKALSEVERHKVYPITPEREELIFIQNQGSSGVDQLLIQLMRENEDQKRQIEDLKRQIEDLRAEKDENNYVTVSRENEGNDKENSDEGEKEDEEDENDKEKYEEGDKEENENEEDEEDETMKGEDEGGDKEENGNEEDEEGENEINENEEDEEEETREEEDEDGDKKENDDEEDKEGKKKENDDEEDKEGKKKEKENEKDGEEDNDKRKDEGENEINECSRVSRKPKNVDKQSSLAKRVREREDRKKKVKNSDFITPPAPKRRKMKENDVEEDEDNSDPNVTLELEMYKGRDDFCGSVETSIEDVDVIESYLSKDDLGIIVWENTECCLPGRLLCALLFGKELSTQLIDCYMEILQSGDDSILYLPTYVQIDVLNALRRRGSIVKREEYEEFTSDLCKTTLFKFDQTFSLFSESVNYIFFPVHTKNHFFLLVLDIKDQKFFYLNSLDTAIYRAAAKTLVQFFAGFIDCKYGLKVEKKLNSRCVQSQKEGSKDCGAFVCLYMDCYTVDTPDMWGRQQTWAIDTYRAHMAARILRHANGILGRQ